MRAQYSLKWVRLVVMRISIRHSTYLDLMLNPHNLTHALRKISAELSHAIWYQKARMHSRNETTIQRPTCLLFPLKRLKQIPISTALKIVKKVPEAWEMLHQQSPLGQELCKWHPVKIGHAVLGDEGMQAWHIQGPPWSKTSLDLMMVSECDSWYSVDGPVCGHS